MRLHSQQTALKVYQRVESRRTDLNQTQFENYQSLTHSMPVNVRRNGLLQTLAFIDSRRNEQEVANQSLLLDLASVLGYLGKEALLEQARTAPALEYMRLTTKVLATLDWFKRLSNAVVNEQ